MAPDFAPVTKPKGTRRGPHGTRVLHQFRDFAERRTTLEGANLSGSNLWQAVLWRASLVDANLSHTNLVNSTFDNCDLTAANLSGANISDASFRQSILAGATLKHVVALKTDFSGADLTSCHIYGISAWDLCVREAIQSKLIITESEPHVRVDDLEVAQFIYLLLKRQKLRNVITTLGDTAVLVLGRFTERKQLLDRIADKLRSLGFLPIIFDFERPTNRDLTETVRVLAGLSRFVIADITNPLSVPLELEATIPDYMVPFVLIIERGRPVFGMFDDLPRKYDWALPLLEYKTADSLMNAFDEKVVAIALEKSEEIRNRKLSSPRRRSAED